VVGAMSNDILYLCGIGCRLDSRAVVGAPRLLCAFGGRLFIWTVRPPGTVRW
jgi:hypothetical protein